MMKLFKALVCAALMLTAVDAFALNDGRIRRIAAEATLLAWTTGVPDGTLAYALDNDTLYVMAAGGWTALGSASGLLGTNGGILENETNNVWSFEENSEDLTLTYGTNSVTFASTTGAVFTVTPATTITGDLTLNGGAGGLTMTAANSSLLVLDNSATGWIAGSTGQLNLITLDTQDDAEKVIITANAAGTTGFHVDVGVADFDEKIIVGEASMLTAKTTLTNANIKAVRGTPITLVAAQGAGTLIVVESVVLALNAGSEALTESADNLVLQYTDSGTDVTGAIEATGLIDQTADTAAIYYPTAVAAAAEATVAVNEAVEIFNTGDGEYAGNASNDATLDVWVKYYVLTL